MVLQLRVAQPKRLYCMDKCVSAACTCGLSECCFCEANDEDNVGIVVGHQLADLHQFWEKYVAEESHDVEITRKGKLKQFENVSAQGCTLSPQTVRVFDFQEGAL